MEGDEEKKESPTKRMRNGTKSFAKIKKDSTDRGGGIKGLLPQVCCGNESRFSAKAWVKTELNIRENVILRTEIVHP